VVVVLAVLGAVLLGTRRQRLTARALALGALCIALSFVLSCIRLYRMPQGGSITPASMLPLIAFAFAYGAGPGMLVGLAYGLLQLLQGADIVHPLQMLLDYPLAFAMVGLAGLARRLSARRGKGALAVGVVLATLGRLLCATLSGWVFFASYAPQGQSPFLYSLVYNASYLGPDALVCALLAMVPGVRQSVLRLAQKQ
jgi:thiamine transporter